MNPHNKTASLAGLTGSVVSKGVLPSNYLNPASPSIEIDTGTYAAVVVATRFRLTISTARVVCHLAGIGRATI